MIYLAFHCLYCQMFPKVSFALCFPQTYNVNKQVADSASTATAYLTGVKTNYKTIGVDGTAIYKNCSSINESNKVSSILQWAQKAGKRTGVVTSTRVTHATPAGTYAHVTDRDWECDGAISAEDEELCPAVKDIATQLVEEEPGKSINVVMGGGYQYFDANAVGTVEDPLETEFVPCNRTNTTNLVDVWKTYHASYSPEFVRTKSDLNKVDAANTQFLLGLFSNGHMPYEYEKREKKLDVPTLEDMTRAAIEILQQEPQGYFLLVEGGRIDHAPRTPSLTSPG
nr:LOW QUALITY PROTEIN: alkaline phosphatase 4-like [Cherax quadricarinatus]